MSLSLLRNADQIPIAPLIALIGPEAFVRQKLKERLIERALGTAIREMNLARFQAGEDDLPKAWDACRDFPCFAERRVVVVSSLAKIRKKEGEEFIRYLTAPTESTVLIVEDDKLDGRLDWVKALKKRAHWVDIPEAELGDAQEWVRILLKREKKSAEGEVISRLVEWMGTSLGALQIALQQLAVYVGERQELRISDLEALFVKLSEENVFGVVDAMFRGKEAELYSSLSRLLAMGEPPLKVLALIYRHISILLSLREGGPRETASVFRLNPYFLRQYESQVGKFGRNLHPGLLAPLSKADFALKSSALPDDLILKNCVEEIRASLAQA